MDIWTSADRFDAERSSESTFVALIARRKLIDCLRSTKCRPQLVNSPESVQHLANQAELKLYLSLEIRQIIKSMNLVSSTQSNSL